MQAAELAQVSNSIKNAMGEGMGSFRKAAMDSSSQVNKVIKDIARTFAEQRKDMAGLENAIQDSVHESEQTNARIDRLAGIFQESISLQTNMFGELKNIGANMRLLNDNTVQMSRNIGGGIGGVTVTSLLSSSLTVLGNLAASAAVGFGLGSMIGLTRTQDTSTTSSAGGSPSASFSSLSPRIIGDLQRDFPGLSKEDAAAIVGNLGEESGGFTKMKEGGGGPGRGWAQWTSEDRKAKFLANVQKHGGDLANYDANYETLRDELKGQYAGALRATMAAQGLQNKTHTFMKQFENPGVEHFDVRMQYAQSAFSGTGSAQESTPVANTPVTPNMTPSADSGHEGHGHGGGHAGIISGALQGGPTTPVDGANGRLSDSMLESIGSGHKLRPEAAKAYQAMVDAARKDGISWSVTDSYRDYDTQVRLANEKGLYSQGGLAARPGTSNHGWGLAVDLGGGANVLNSKENQWLQQNAPRFGFSHLPGEGGLHKEPWHWEFKGGGATPGAIPEGSQTPSGGTTTPITGGSGGGGGTQPQASVNPLEQSALMGLMGMGGGMGMMGGLGGIMGMAGILGNIASSIPMPEPAGPSESNMLKSVAQNDMNTMMINQAAVQKQAQEEMGRESAVPESIAREPSVNSSEMGGGKGYDYNHPGDREWASWVSMLGGAHYKELGEGTAFNLFGK